MPVKNIELSSPVLCSNRQQHDFENSTKIKSCKIKSFYAKPFIFIYRSSIILGTLNNLAASFIVLTRNPTRSLSAEWRMTDSRSGEKSLCQLDLNIHLYLTLNYVTASEHLLHRTKTLWCFIMCLRLLWGLTITIVYAQYRIWIRLVWPIPRSGRKCQYRSDTDPEYRIGAPLTNTITNITNYQLLTIKTIK